MAFGGDDPFSSSRPRTFSDPSQSVDPNNAPKTPEPKRAVLKRELPVFDLKSNLPTAPTSSNDSGNSSSPRKVTHHRRTIQLESPTSNKEEVNLKISTPQNRSEGRNTIQLKPKDDLKTSTPQNERSRRKSLATTPTSLNRSQNSSHPISPRKETDKRRTLEHPSSSSRNLDAVVSFKGSTSPDLGTKSPSEILSPRASVPYDQIAKLIEELALFSSSMTKKNEDFEKNLETKKNDDPQEFSRHESEIPSLRQQFFQREFQSQWVMVRDKLDKMLCPRESNFAPINFKNLGLDEVTDPFKSDRKSLTKKSIKLDSHQAHAREFIKELLLNFEDSKIPFYQEKVNLMKMNRFRGTKEEDLTAIFNYVQDLLLLGEVVKKGSSNDFDPKNPFVKYSKEFIKNIEHLKEFKDLDSKEKELVIKDCFEQAGDLSINYAKAIVKKRVPLDSEFISYSSEKIKEGIQRLLAPQGNSFATFQADLDRAVNGRFLHFVVNNKSPLLEELNDKNLLQFFITHLEIESGDATYLLKMFESEKSLEKIYTKLEEQFKKETQKFVGAFKLLPLLRCFNQAILFGLQSQTMFFEKMVSKVQSSKIIKEFVHADTSSQKSKESKLDEETKSITFDFKEDSIQVTLKRVGTLEKDPKNSDGIKPELNCFFDCTITSTTLVSANRDNLDQWNAQIEMDIEYPKTLKEDLQFLSQLSALLASLELMEARYTIKEI